MSKSKKRHTEELFKLLCFHHLPVSLSLSLLICLETAKVRIKNEEDPVKRMRGMKALKKKKVF